jgi:drug/metabolite transporter (DMT)-like permease
LNSAVKASAVLILTMVIWGSGAVFIRSFALALTPENSLALRYAILTAINIAGLVWLGTWRVPRADWLQFLLAGLIGMGGYNWFVNAGFALVPAGLGTIITMAEPLMIAFLASVMLNEKLTPYAIAGLALASLGAVVLFWKDIIGDSEVSFKGVVWLLICCLSWALYTVWSKPLLQKYDSFTVTAITMTIAAPVLVYPATKPLAELAGSLTTRQCFELAYLVLPNALIGTMMWNYGAKYLSGAATGAFLYLIPVVAVIAGALILGESVTPHIVAGGLIILAGVALAQSGHLVFAKRAA